METYVIGDIHGAFRALQQVLERSPFRPGLDRLIQLGDVADGWPETPQCVELLLSVPNSIWLQGNHDWWAAEWLLHRLPRTTLDQFWYKQGGKATFNAYMLQPAEVGKRHFHDFFGKQLPYFEDESGNLYVHASYDPMLPITEQAPEDLIWSRTLWREHLAAVGYEECFIGHTSTWLENEIPCQRANVWNLDQGAGFQGRLSMMNVRTKEFVQSDVVQELYPGIKGR
ncbi:metallophosphoesterase [Hymenobacter sp. BT186]|uniref:Metallophosphoesterase n=1 Tax=Hymenobacter telluris TaxID=2816474 RepID=A0A939EU69_9BACT|nr:metallophosphoesterase [Hymenobacter telluris]MBO0357316.1 metallophosphoesterase [Hymenobacter telluris]MBW3373342.1 metallophosphoesterase [Hymenobacter norwichensis]